VAMVRDRSLAEDLLQDTFHDVLRARAQLSSIDNERAWLYGIARHARCGLCAAGAVSSARSGGWPAPAR
jgi:DNA-directed RNA polymerase specialized sigma24 family protein